MVRGELGRGENCGMGRGGECVKFNVDHSITTTFVTDRQMEECHAMLFVFKVWTYLGINDR